MTYLTASSDMRLTTTQRALGLTQYRLASSGPPDPNIYPTALHTVQTTIQRALGCKG